MASCTKALSSLKTLHLDQIKGGLYSLKCLELLLKNNRNINNPSFHFKKTIRSSKRLETLKIEDPLTDEQLRNIRYIQKLQILHLKLTDKQLPGLSHCLLTWDSLKSISVLIAKESPNDSIIRDPSHFLTFCRRVLTKKNLKAFRVDFDSNYGHYSSDTFEELFSYLEQSSVEQWNLQVILLEDKILKLAETYNVFKQVECLAIHPPNHRTYCRDGLKPSYGSFDRPTEINQNNSKCLSIHLVKYIEDKIKFEESFNLRSLLRQCLKLECLFLDWLEIPLTQLSPEVDDTFKGYQALKTIYFKEDNFFVQRNSQDHLKQIIEETPFLQKLYFKIYQIDDSSPVNSVESYVKTLKPKRTLKCLDISLTVSSQSSLDALQSLLLSLPDLEELDFTLKFPRGGTTLPVPVIPFEHMLKLTQIQLFLPDSPKDCLENLKNNLHNLNNLKILEIKNTKTESISLDFVLSFIKKLEGLTQLCKFTFQSNIISDLSSTQDGEKGEPLLKTELEIIEQQFKHLIAKSKSLECIDIRLVHLASFQYAKSMI